MSEHALHRVLVVAALVAALAIVVDAVMVGAPYLAIVSVPFVVGALLHRRAERLAAVVIGLMGLLYTGVAVNYIRSSGSDWPVGDYIGVIVGGTAALIAAGMAIGVLVSWRTTKVV